MKARTRTLIVGLALAALCASTLGGVGTRNAAATLPPGNVAQQWDKIAEDTVVGSGAVQIESFVYMAYATSAMYDAAVAVDGHYRPLGHHIHAARGASVDAAVVEAAYRTLSHYFPSAAPTLDALYAQAIAALPVGPSTTAGQAVGLAAANEVLDSRSGDGLTTPIATTSTFPTLAPGPRVWRLTPPAFLPPQVPWVANMHPFILREAGQFQPPPPPASTSTEWVSAFNEVKYLGQNTSLVRTQAETDIAKFWSANPPRQYNIVARDLATARGADVLDSTRLFAMVDVIGADAGIAVMQAKYHYLFWRPVTAIDPTSVTAADGFGPSPGYDDGNVSTVEQPGWRPLLTTPNHPEYPSAHGSVSGAIVLAFSAFLGTDQVNLTIHGFDPTAGKPATNLDAVRTFATADDLRSEIVNARVWAGLHYRFSGAAGITLGTTVAQYDLKHAFKQQGDGD
ncbi:MAG TPA: vanadium-dependent haloperoxidase [Gaiellaceae bacterium]